MKRYRYYSTQRPVSLGTYPRRENVVEIHNYDQRTLLDNGIRAWGYIDYNSPLTPAEMSDYELVEPKAISIDNGNTFVTPKEAIEGMRWEVIAHYMEDDAREQVHCELAPCTNLEFLTRYLEVAKSDLIIG